MSECVVRMEMPRHCFNCSRKVDPETRMCLLDGHLFEETFGVITAHRDKNCPILTVLPEKHGRLVDMRDIDSMMEDIQTTSDESGLYGLYYRDDFDFDGLPTIVPAMEGGNHEAD